MQHFQPTVPTSELSIFTRRENIAAASLGKVVKHIAVSCACGDFKPCPVPQSLPMICYIHTTDPLTLPLALLWCWKWRPTSRV